MFFYEGDDHESKERLHFEKIGGTTFIINALLAESAKHTQEEVVKALIEKEVMAMEVETTA